MRAPEAALGSVWRAPDGGTRAQHQHVATLIPHRLLHHAAPGALRQPLLRARRKPAWRRRCQLHPKGNFSKDECHTMVLPHNGTSSILIPWHSTPAASHMGQPPLGLH